MENKISLLAFVHQPLPHRAIAEYESVFADACGECRFERFADSCELFTALAGAFGKTETVVLAVTERYYLQIKKLLFAALRTKTESSAEIAEVLKNGDGDFCLMPADAQILMTDDGKYCGFIEKSGKQTLVFVPLSDGRCAKIAEQLRAVFAPGTGAKETEKSEDVPEGELCEEEKCNPEEVVELLKERGISVAVATGKNSPFVFSVLPYDDEPDFADVIFAQQADGERREDESHGEYTAAMAGRARLNSGASVGAAISNVFRSDEEDSKYFMFICIADENKARVFKVYSRKGESTQQFIYACVHRLYSSLADYAKNGFVLHNVDDDTAIVIEEGSIRPIINRLPCVRARKPRSLWRLLSCSRRLSELRLHFWSRATARRSARRSLTHASPTQARAIRLRTARRAATHRGGIPQRAIRTG